MIILIALIGYMLLMMPIAMFINTQITRGLFKLKNKKAIFFVNFILTLPMGWWVLLWLQQWAS